MLPDLTFGPLLLPGGGNVGPIALNPSIPHAGQGFAIQWADLNLSAVAAGAYSDLVWITDDRNNNVTVWSSEKAVAGLAPGQSTGLIVNVPPNAIAPGTYTFHVYINAAWVGGPSVAELNPFNNYSFNGNISVRS